MRIHLYNTRNRAASLQALKPWFKSWDNHGVTCKRAYLYAAINIGLGQQVARAMADRYI